MKRRIFVIATDGAGCWFYRLHLPMTHLNPEEFEVIWGPPGGARRPGDIVIGQRIAGRNTAWLEMCEDPTLTAIYEIDDNILDIDPGNTVPYSIFAPMVDDTQDNIAAAQHVITSTPKLARALSLANPNITSLPNCLPAAWLQAPPRERYGDLIVVGWAGSPFHDQDFGGVGEQLATYYVDEPRARFHMIGADPSRGAVPRSVSPFTAMGSYLSMLDFDLGFVPLSKTRFNDHKSWIKVLEYASRWIPAVAMNWGQYPEFIEHGVNGYLIEDISELSLYLKILSDDTLRLEMSQAAHEKALEFEISRQVHRWESLFREV